MIHSKDNLMMYIHNGMFASGQQTQWSVQLITRAKCVSIIVIQAHAHQCSMALSEVKFSNRKLNDNTKDIDLWDTWNYSCYCIFYKLQT